MPRPTLRGLALLCLAGGSYLAGRIVGTWELYLFAFAFLAAVLVTWLLVIVTGRKIRVSRGLAPERPVAGDEPELHMSIRNSSWLPGPQMILQSPLGTLGGEDMEFEVESLSPREHKAIKTSVNRVRRGVHHVPAARVVAEDPLGLATAVHRASGPLRVTVYPRITLLDSCVLHPHLGLRRDWGGQHCLPAPGASEFRGVRPHQPGEPLSHIDWKSTAKTGILMLRETEEPAGAEATVVLDGTALHVVGRLPDTNYELAVRAAGSIADFALRAGRDVTLVSHQQALRQAKLTADSSGRSMLLEMLAEANPDAAGSLVHALRRLRADHARLLQAQSVTLVSLSLDHHLVRALVALHEDGVRLALVYVAGGSFAEAAPGVAAPILPFLPPRLPRDAGPAGGRRQRAEGRWSTTGAYREGARSGHSLPPEVRSGLLSLASAGIPCVTLFRGDDVAHALSLSRQARGREMRRG